MGDPKRIQGKFSRPLKRWDKTRIDEEKKLLKEYSLKNKSEIWKAYAKVSYLTTRVKLLVRERGASADMNRDKFLAHVKAMGFVPEQSTLDQVLGLQTRNILDRRLQTIVCKKNLAHTMKQARQFITHNHIVLKDRVINRPSYLVPLAEENAIAFKLASTLSSADHPERTVKKKEPKKEQKRRGPPRRGRQ